MIIMTNLNLKQTDLTIDSLATPDIPSPLGLSRIMGDNIANYVDDTESVLLHHDRQQVLDRIQADQYLPAFGIAPDQVSSRSALKEGYKTTA